MSEVYYSDQAGYVELDNTIARDALVCLSFRDAYALLRKSFIFQYHQELADEASAVREAQAANLTILSKQFPGMPYSSARMSQLHIDYFLIGTFFEIVAKAVILERGYLIHKIRTTPSNPAIDALRKNQKNKPVVISEYRDIDPFVDNGNGRKGMQRLQHATLDYAWIYEGEYAALLPFSEDFILLAREYRHFRNLIHFPSTRASESIADIEPEPLDHYEVINNEVEAVVRPLFDRLQAGLISKFPLEG